MDSQTSQCHSRLKNFPVSFFSIVMGLCGFVIASKQMFLPHLPDAALRTFLHWGLNGFPLVLFIYFLILYGLKWIRYSDAVRAEFNHPVKLSFFPTISISLLLLSIVYLKDAPMFSQGLCAFGGLLHLSFTVVILGRWVEQTSFTVESVNPAWFIPIVGNILVPISATHHFPMEISWLFFSVGLIFWLQLATIVLYRKVFHTPIPQKFAPTYFILIAPPALGFLSYTNLNGGVLDAMAQVLYHFGLFTTVFVFYLSRKVYSYKFFLSFWAYSFPLAAMTVASFKYWRISQLSTYGVIAQGLYGILTLVILLLLYRTAVAVLRREICSEEH